MNIQENILLAPFTTFKIGGPASYFCVVETPAEVMEAFEFAKQKALRTFVLGGGSNVLVGDNGFDGLVIKVANKGKQIISEDGEIILLKVAAGEVWDDVVVFAVNKDCWGIENLSHIPGSTGTIVVQNVGAYGQEASAVVETVTVIDSQSGELKTLNNSECGFDYRQSIFNSTDRGRYIIFELTIRLKKNGQPNLSYRDLKSRFEGQNPSLMAIRQAVTEIRDTKFPFPVEAKNGNVGSFFKNPILFEEEFMAAKNTIGTLFGEEAVTNFEIKAFREAGKIKIPAAFLIELCGLKDVSVDGAAVNHNQPLVILNASGRATAGDVAALAKLIQDKVMASTGILLKAEPEFVGIDPGSLK